MTDIVKKNILQVLLLVALSLYILIKDVTIPLLNGSNPNRSPNQQMQIIERLARVEEGTRKLEMVPERVAALVEATSSLKTSVDRLEKKIDDHVAHGK